MKTLRKFYIGAAGILAAVAAILVVSVVATNSQAMSSYRNCNSDAILKCGAISKSELLQKYDQNTGDVKNVYSHYGISRTDIAGTTSDVKAGTVYQDGRVVVDGKTVATGAYSVSRVKFTSAGEPRTVKINGTTYYEGPSMRIFTRSVDAFVMFRDGKFYKAVLSSCGNPIVATPEEPEPKPEPIYRCDNLTSKKLDRTRYRFMADATARNGAEIVSYTFDFGDGTSETSEDDTIEHEYAEAGNYTVTVSVEIEVDGKTETVTDEDCEVKIEIEEEQEYCPLPGKEHLPVDSPECEEEEKCPVPGKEHLPKDSADCYENCEVPGKEHLPKDSPECKETPPELPETGFDMFIGGSLGLGSITAAGYYWISSRKNLLDTLLDR